MSESRTGIVSEKKKKHIESMIELGKKRVIAEFIIIDNETNHGFLIDPAAEANKLLNYINVNNLIIEKILIILEGYTILS